MGKSARSNSTHQNKRKSSCSRTITPYWFSYRNWDTLHIGLHFEWLKARNDDDFGLLLQNWFHRSRMDTFYYNSTCLRTWLFSAFPSSHLHLCVRAFCPLVCITGPKRAARSIHAIRYRMLGETRTKLQLISRYLVEIRTITHFNLSADYLRVTKCQGSFFLEEEDERAKNINDYLFK